jgi:hypothetical protein
MSRVISDDIIRAIMSAGALTAPISPPSPPATNDKPKKQPQVVIGTVNIFHLPKEP